MAYNAKSFTMWVSYYDVAQELTPREQGEFYRAIMDYMFKGEDREPELGKAVRISFKAIKANLKRSVANRRGIGEESGQGTSTRLESESPLNLNLNSNLKKKSAGSGSGGGKPAPPTACPRCGESLERTSTHDQRGRTLYRCPKCFEEVMA